MSCRIEVDIHDDNRYDQFFLISTDDSSTEQRRLDVSMKRSLQKLTIRAVEVEVDTRDQSCMLDSILYVTGTLTVSL